jgi:phosphoglycolate phosphatase
MLTACQYAEVNAENCVYIGDAQHDIIAGKAANMKTLVATYGCLTPDDQPENWGANKLIKSPLQIQEWIQQNLCY